MTETVIRLRTNITQIVKKKKFVYAAACKGVKDAIYTIINYKIDKSKETNGGKIKRGLYLMLAKICF